jgi:hypothetical protein
MLMVLELLVALVVGFVLGRIWEIRQEIRRDYFHRHVANRQRPVDTDRQVEAGYRLPTAHLNTLIA